MAYRGRFRWILAGVLATGLAGVGCSTHADEQVAATVSWCVMGLIQNDEESRACSVFDETPKWTQHGRSGAVHRLNVEILDRRLRGHNHHIIGRLDVRG